MYHLKNYGLAFVCIFGGNQIHAAEIVRAQSYDPAASALAGKSVPVQGSMDEKIQQIEERLGLAQSLDKDKTHKDQYGRIVWEYSNVEVADRNYRFGAVGYSGSYGMKCFNEKGQPGYNPNKLMQCGGLMGVNLSNTDLSGGIDLRGASLSNATMRCTNIQGGQLQGATIHGADLSGLNRDCSSSEAFKNTAIKSATDFEGARLTKSSLNQANLNRSILTNVEAIGTSFKDAQMVNSRLSGDFSGAKFNNANLRFALIDNMDAQGADFSGADFRGSIISGLRFDNTTNFTGAKFDISHPENLPFSVCSAIMLGMLPFDGEQPVHAMIEDFYDVSAPGSIVINGNGADVTTPQCKVNYLGEAPVLPGLDGLVSISGVTELSQEERRPERKVWFTNLFNKSKIVGVTLEN